MKSVISNFICLLAAVLMSGCGKTPPPMPPDIQMKLLQSFECRRLDTNEPLPVEIILERGTGFYVELKFEPTDPMPADVDGTPVHRIGTWPMGILIFPRGSARTSAKTTFSFFSPYSSHTGSFASPEEGPAEFPRLAGTGNKWFEHGYSGEPKSDASTSSCVRWTYLCQPKDDNTEFEYELLVWPCIDDSKASEIKLGSAIVLQRGILELVENSVN